MKAPGGKKSGTIVSESNGKESGSSNSFNSGASNSSELRRDELRHVELWLNELQLHGAVKMRTYGSSRWNASHTDGNDDATWWEQQMERDGRGTRRGE